VFRINGCKSKSLEFVLWIVTCCADCQRHQFLTGVIVAESGDGEGSHLSNFRWCAVGECNFDQLAEKRGQAAGRGYSYRLLPNQVVLGSVSYDRAELFVQIWMV
jgi:hypothetical protein